MKLNSLGASVPVTWGACVFLAKVDGGRAKSGMLIHKRGVLGLVAAALLLGGCAHGMSRGGSEAGDPETVLQVTNNNWSDMAIYLVRGGMRQRLGTAGSLTTSKFRLPSHIFASPDPLRLVADPIGGAAAHVSQPLLLSPGQTVEWRLENNLHLSSAFIRG